MGYQSLICQLSKMDHADALKHIESWAAESLRLIERGGDQQQRLFTNSFSQVADLDFILESLKKFKCSSIQLTKNLVKVLGSMVYHEENQIMLLISKNLSRIVRTLDDIIMQDNCIDVSFLLTNLLSIQQFRSTLKQDILNSKTLYPGLLWMLQGETLQQKREALIFVNNLLFTQANQQHDSAVIEDLVLNRNLFATLTSGFLSQDNTIPANDML